jgi:hypothetical protein
VALTVLEKIFKALASFRGFSLPVQKIFGISEQYEKNLERTTQGIFLQKISFLVIAVSEKIFRELLARTCNAYASP